MMNYARVGYVPFTFPRWKDTIDHISRVRSADIVYTHQKKEHQQILYA